MQLNPYLTFSGQCEAAFKFYEKVLGGKIEAMHSHAGSPMEDRVPPGWRSKIMHASLKVDGNVLMGSDAPPDRYEQVKGFTVTLGVNDPSEAERALRPCRKTGRCKCRSRRPSGLPALGCS